MLRTIESDFKLYNANTRNKNVGDCVKRSMSLAFNMDYDAVSSELNSIKRDIGATAFNIGPVFNRFLSRRGISFAKLSPRVTEEQFAEEHPSGTYLVLSGAEKLAAHGGSSHMCAIINGDIYDSWDSSDFVVVQFCKVNSETANFYDDLDVDLILDDIIDFGNKYGEYLSTKTPYAEITCRLPRYDSRSNRYTGKIQVIMKMIQAVPEARLSEGQYFLKDIVIKLSPRKTREDNIHDILPKIKQKIYDFVYNIKKPIDDSIKASSIEINPEFRGDKSELMKLPEWIRPYVTRIWFNTGGWWKYEVYADPLEGDPRGKPGNDVVFQADTMKELKNQMEMYKEDYSRVNYDY